MKKATSKATTTKKSAAATSEFEPFALLTADLHLQPCAWANRRRCHGDAYWAFRQIVRLAKKHKVDHIIAAGDILDAKRHDTAVPHEIQQLLEYVREAEVYFHFIQGDHDGLETPWPTLLAPGNDYVRHEQCGSIRRIGPANFQFIDWQPPDKLATALDAVDRNADVLVMHQTLDELTGGIWPGEMSVAQVKHAQMLIIGDIHTASVSAHVGADGQEVTVVSPGSPCKQSIDEADSKSVYLLGHSDGVLAVKRLPLLSRTTLRYVVNEEADVTRLMQTLTQDIENAVEAMQSAGVPDDIADYPLIAVEIDTTQLTEWARIRRAVGKRAELFRQPRGQMTRPVGTVEEVAQASLSSKAKLEIVRHGVSAAIRQQVTDEVDRDLLLRLWQAENPNKELQLILTEAGL